MFRKIHFFILSIISLLILLSCQKNEFIEDVHFDNSLLNNISIYANKKEIKVSYESTFDEPFIDHVMDTPPSQRIILWLEDNINHFGNMNRIVVNIQKSSIVQKDIVNQEKVAGISKKQNEYLYELNFEVKFNLYNDNNEILADTNVVVFRSTTSSKFISLNERNRVLNKLTLDSLKDLANKSEELIKLHMSEYIL